MKHRAVVLAIAVLPLVATPARAAEFFQFGLIADGGRECRVYQWIMSSVPRTVDVISGDVTFDAPNGERIDLRRFRFEYLDPGKTLGAWISLSEPCERYGKAKMRAIAICRIAGQYVSDCLNFFNSDARTGMILKKRGNR